MAAESYDRTTKARDVTPTETASLSPGKTAPHSRVPDKIGPFKILEVLGEGGMGTVYLAEQTDPIRRRVALKVIKLGMDTKHVIARFETERQALALMDHPNVARVLDAGATEDGRPYFVMEHVAGEPITKYCDRHRLSTTERVQLFTQVCHAVQHAHQKGIIHRDIKPTNVLVTVKEGEAVPKVIDFGVAKATEQSLTEKTLFTEQGQLIGTPEYMSPEQAEMTALDVDTRTDIFSLGVLLYELLVGALPFDPKSLRRAGFAEIQRIIREVEPPKPSTRLSSLGDSSAEVAQMRRTEVRALTRALRGDLDWIVMKAMEKDRTRRYATASELADDLRRFVQNEPVLASPPRASYHLAKFVRRNRARIPLVVLVVVILIIGYGSWSRTRHLSGLARMDRFRSVLADSAHFDTQEAGKLFVGFLRRLKNGNTTWEERALFLSQSVQLDLRTRQLHSLDHPQTASVVVDAPWYALDNVNYPITFHLSYKLSFGDREIRSVERWKVLGWKIRHYANRSGDPTSLDWRLTADLSFVWVHEKPDGIAWEDWKPQNPIWTDHRVITKTVLVVRSLPESYPVTLSDPETARLVESGFTAQRFIVDSDESVGFQFANEGPVYLAGLLQILHPDDGRLLAEIPGFVAEPSTASMFKNWVGGSWGRDVYELHLRGELETVDIRVVPDRKCALSNADLELYWGLPIFATAPVATEPDYSLFLMPSSSEIPSQER